ncbi:MAG: type II toxin-antitoxin system RelE/ParE family toxin [Acidobacteriota bacterium]|nr:type II toxin-antitoxin system RelE/ParE family toxin [Acidobacteriota bacterium]
MRLEFFEEALAEAEEDRAWYRDRSDSAEAGFLRELDHAIQQVTDGHAQWPQYLAGTRRYVFPTYPYSIVYFVEDDVIRIAAVAHDKRRPGYWRKRLRRSR